ncbi:MAG: branched-chain amino acid ABC transporter permease [Nitrososphaerales archaeon]
MVIDPIIIAQLLWLGLLRGSIYALMSLGLSLTFGVMRIVNFAHGEFFMLGAYISYFLLTFLGINPLISFISTFIVLGISFILGAGISRTFFSALRLRSGKEWIIDSFVLTLGLSVMLQNLALALWTPVYRGIPYLWNPSTLKILEISTTIDRIAILFGSLLAIFIFWYFLSYTFLGKAIRAVSQNEEAAKSLGVNENKIYTLTFGLSSMLASLAGVLLLPFAGAYPTVGVNPLLKSFIVVILSGLGNIHGAIFGGFFVGIIETFAIFYTEEGWNSVILLALLIIVLIIRPTGFFGKRVRYV